MTRYSKYNLVYRMQKWMDSVPGQTFMNYAYSWGASVVILGTLFKLTHLPGANLMLFIGMGTEVFVFFISAYDRPFDKTTIDMELATHYEESSPDDHTGTEAQEIASGANVPQGVVVVGGIPASGGIIADGNSSPSDATAMPAGVMAAPTGQNAPATATATQGGAAAGQIVIGQTAVPSGANADNTQKLSDAQSGYIEQLKSLTETLQSVAEQSKKLAFGSEEMENLNRAITGISTMYEMQLKSVSQQVGTIDSINEQTRHMAELIAELNKIYTRMVEAMTSNMRVATTQQP